MVRFELLLLATLAASALAALIESARRAAPADGSELLLAEGAPGAVLRASLEELERAWARLDESAPRTIVALGALAGAAGAGGLACGAACAEIGAMLIALGVGLGAPGVSWARDVRAHRSDLARRIARVRARLARLDGDQSVAPMRRAASAIVTSS